MNPLERIRHKVENTYGDKEYPALKYQADTWRKTRPLSGLRLLDAAPLFRNTLTKHMALLEAGADLTIGISEVIAHDPAILDFVFTAGLPVVKAEEVPGQEFDMILDCAAAFSGWPAARGYVELTRSGVGKYRYADKPVYVADSGCIKRIETSLGTGESYFRAMEQMGYCDWAGRSLVVFGSGKVGSGIIMYAKRKGASVTVVSDPATVAAHSRRLADRIIDFRHSQAVADAILGAYAVVTATGVAGAVSMTCPVETIMRSEALMANMGVEDEYGAEVPASRILCGKTPVNFTLAEPTHLKYIDATMALHNAGALYLMSHRAGSGLITPDKETEEDLLRISRTNGLVAEEIDMIL